MPCQRLQTDASRRRAFTLIELLVALTVLAIVLAILLPAVQSIRSTARQTQCQNHLHQIGTAVQNFESRSGHCPRYHNFWPVLLEDLEQGALLERIESHQPVDAVVDVLTCPSDDWIDDATPNPSYFGNAGTRFRELGASNGFLDFNYGRRLPDITDGLSNSAMVSERLIDRDPLALSFGAAEFERLPKRFVWFIPETINGAGQEAALIAACSSQRYAPIPYVSPWSFGVASSGYGYDHMLPPNSTGCLNGNAAGYDKGSSAAPGTSLHAGGVNVAMCDGHVRFVSESISDVVWRAVGTVNGGEPASW